MAKSKKSVKRKKKNPPLSKQDKFLYSCIEVLGGIILVGLVYGYQIFAYLLILKRPDVLAFEEQWTLFLIVPAIFYWMFLIIKAINKKTPIIGNSKIDYFKTTDYKFVLPLFDNRYKNNEKYIKGRKDFFKKSIIYVSVFIVLLIIGAMGCVGRHEFNENGIVTYSILNNKTKEYSYDDVDSYSVSANVNHVVGHRGLSYRNYNIFFVVKMKDGESFTAKYDRVKDIYALEKIDSKLKDKKKEVSTEYLEEFLDRHDFTDDELRVIDKIFEE